MKADTERKEGEGRYRTRKEEEGVKEDAERKKDEGRYRKEGR